MPGLRVVTGLWAYALIGLTLFADRPGDLLAGAAVVAALLLVVLLAARPRPVTGPGLGRRAVGLRDRARRRRVPRQVDPDAAGRPRPRAPGRCSPVGWSPVAG
ncbi:DUF6412 domain-containing protein [Micromonospora sp. NBC_00421]|uniref:DUF6412 domain-containing protein n=1 Tax=Micromonospora sp. NBC_00421 TaxID=2975976 RepID=UPI002E234CF6